MTDITDAKILIIATDGFERSELHVPRDQLKERGATVHLATPDAATIKSWDEDNWGDSIDADLSLEDARIEDYDALVIPGGQINPDILRTKETAVQIVKDAVAQGKTVAAICHGPWMLVEADVVRGRKITSYPSIRTDLKNAGGEVVDETVVADRGVVTSRSPEDLDAFVNEIVRQVEQSAARQPDAA